MIGRTFPRRVVSLVLTTILLPTLAAETLLRVHNPLQSRVRGDQIVLLSNKTYTIRNTTVPRLPPTISFRLNSLGFRGPDPPAPFATYLSIVAIGGSTTQCFFLSDNLTWSDRLAERLKQTFRRVWVNNAGLDGHSTLGHLVLVRDYIVPLRPRLALFLIGLNDINRSGLSPFEHETTRAGLAFASPQAFVKSLAPYSELASTLLNLVRSYEAYQRGLIHRPIDVRLLPQREIGEETLERYIRSLANDSLVAYEHRVNALIDQTTSNGIEPVLITQPMLLGAGLDDITGVDLAKVANGSRTGVMYWRSLEVYNDVVRRVGRERGVLVIDLASRLPKSSRFFYDFTHFTVAGAEEVARIINSSLCPALITRFASHAYAECQ